MIKVREEKETVEKTSQSESPEQFSIELNKLGTLDENTHVKYEDDLSG